MNNSALLPLERNSLVNLLLEQRWCEWIKGENDLSVETENGYVICSLSGEHDEILTVRGIWRHHLPRDCYQQALEFCNEENASTLVLKTYVEKGEPEEDEQLYLLAEVVIDYEHGASDEQLMLHISSAFVLIDCFWEALAEAFDV